MLPPGSRRPALVQALRYGRDPLGFLAASQRRYGDIFTVRFPYFGRIVYVAEPDLVKEVFTGSPATFHAGEANAACSSPRSGPTPSSTYVDRAIQIRPRRPRLSSRQLLPIKGSVFWDKDVDLKHGREVDHVEAAALTDCLADGVYVQVEGSYQDIGERLSLFEIQVSNDVCV